MKVDMFCHILPEKYLRKVEEVAPGGKDMNKRVRNVYALYDLDERFRIMDMFDDYVQVLTLAAPPIETFGPPTVTAELARIANDEMAALIAKYPDRFLGFVASLPLNDPEAALREAERALTELGAKGVQLFSNINGKPLDSPEFFPILELMAHKNRPIWIHPARAADFPDYKTEDKSKYEIWFILGWPYETSVCMARLVFAGIFKKFPDLRIITHHMGGVIPHVEGRIGPAWDMLGSRTSDEDYSELLRYLELRPIEYFRKFYADTALFGAFCPTLCGIAFFGADQVVFATDMPFDQRPRVHASDSPYIRRTIQIVEDLPIPPKDKEKIFELNAKKLLGLE